MRFVIVKPPVYILAAMADNMTGRYYMKSNIAILALAFIIAAESWAELEYKGLDLGKDDCLLFSTQTELPGDGGFGTLFASDLNGGGTAQLTVYPEQVSLVEGGARLQVQNRFGLFRSDRSLSGLAPVAGYPSFARGSSVRQGRLLPCAASPDGAYVLTAVPSSPAYARLVLFDVAKGSESVVASKVGYSIESLPARWSPDSRNFVYSKDNSIYYYSVDQLSGSRVLDEEYRRIGVGRIQCARWASDGSLFYLKDNALFRILPAEFFTQALYRGVAGMGVLAGKTPFPFDPNFDDFWVSRDGSRIILSKGGRNLFLIYLDPDDFGSEPRVTALPYLFLQGDTVVRDVIWPAGGMVTVFTGSLRDGSRTSGAYRLAAPPDPALVGLTPAVQSLDVQGALELVLSPDESKIAIVTSAGLTLRSYVDWSVRAQVKAPGALHALWLSGDRVVVAGSALIETVIISTGQRNLVALAQAEKYGRSDEGSFYIQAGGAPYRRPALAGEAITKASSSGNARGGWIPASAFLAAPPSSSSPAYRVYLDALAAGSYRNNLMVRSVKALGTRPLFPPPATSYAAFPDRDDPRNGSYFDHGSRIRRRELSISFDAIGSAEGLVGVLNVLKDYGITATFFVNGEFVRQSPGAARLLAGSGNEIGSMFFSAVDPTDTRFKIDTEYVRRGLARAEDEWFSATGKELSLLWHTPYYTVNTDILAAGASMNYSYVGRDVDPLDWVTKADSARLPGAYLDAHRIVEKVVAEAKPGSIIPIRLGISDGGRDDYLFRELALLIDDLIASGYQIVPVSTLIEHAN
jgi:peptidoglycan/xylan/chitin deacetylase (PgdA/CDA1 family)